MILTGENCSIETEDCSMDCLGINPGLHNQISTGDCCSNVTAFKMY